MVQRILSNPLVAFARADHPLARECAIPLERLAREPLLMREPGSGTRMIAERLFETAVYPVVAPGTLGGGGGVSLPGWSGGLLSFSSRNSTVGFVPSSCLTRTIMRH